MIPSNALMVESAPPILGLASVVPSTSTPKYISMKNADRLTVVIIAKNATTVTGSAISLKQATAVAGTSEKALAFTRVDLNNDAAASDAFVNTAVVGNTFTLDATNSKNIIAVIEVKGADFDVAGGFDCFRVATGDGTAQTVTVLYIPRDLRYQGPPLTMYTD